MTLAPETIAIVDALGTALLHFLWQGAAIGLLFWLMRALCETPTARYRLGMFALLALIAWPAITLVRLWPVAGVASSDAGFDVSAASAIVDGGLSNWRLAPLLPWFVALWSCGVLVIAARALWQWRRLQRLVRAAEPAGARWQARLAGLCERFGVSRPVRLLASAQVLTPMLVGWMKPVILLPASLLSGFPPEQLELIIAHELGHIRRWDYLANLAQVVVETVLFYHPVVHWISRDVRNAREECCDDLVLRTTSGKALTYAHALAGLEQLRLDMTASALGAGGGVLIARVRRIVGVGAMAQQTPRNFLLPLMLLAALLASLTWRMQQRDDARVGEILSGLSGRVLALVSGNPQLIAPPSLTVAPLAPQAMPLAFPALTIAPPLDSDVAIERPHAAAMAAVKLARAPDLSASLLADLRIAPLDDVSAEVEPPLHMVSPAYPQRAMSAGIEGNVELAYAIRADGSVGQVRVLHAQPASVFDDAAKTALSAWTFPASAAGQTRHQNFVFALGKAADKCQSPTGTMICRKPGD